MAAHGQDAGDSGRAALACRLDAGLATLDPDIDPGQRACLIDYLLLLTRWNRAYNLTAVREPLEMVARHLLDSLAVRPYLHGERVLDLGTGAGLPGLVLAVAEPRRHFTLLDSNGKKLRFVRQAVLELGLTNVAIVQSRIAAYRPTEKFSTIVTRAVAASDVISAAGEQLLAHSGSILLMLARVPTGPMSDLPGCNPLTPRLHRVVVPLLDAPRHVLELRREFTGI